MGRAEVGVMGAGAVSGAYVLFEPRGDRCHVELALEDGQVVNADERDYFEALLSIRRQLEPAGVKVVCQGARRDVWPSGMARDAGAGLSVYVLTMGQRPRREDLVGIFEPVDPSLIGSVADQEQHWRSWLSSIS